MHKTLLATILIIFSELLIAAERISVISEDKSSITRINFYIGNQSYLFVSDKQDSLKITQEFKKNVAVHVIWFLVKENKLYTPNSQELLSLCREELPFPEEARQSVSAMLPLWDAIAKGIILKNEKNISAVEVYDISMRHLPAPPDIKFWLLASEKYSVEWAKKFLAYDKAYKIDALMYASIIQIASYAALGEKLFQEWRNDFPTENESYFKNYVMQKINSVSVRLPEKEEKLRHDIEKTATDMIVNANPDDKKLQILVEAIKDITKR